MPITRINSVKPTLPKLKAKRPIPLKKQDLNIKPKKGQVSLGFAGTVLLVLKTIFGSGGTGANPNKHITGPKGKAPIEQTIKRGIEGSLAQYLTDNKVQTLVLPAGSLELNNRDLIPEFLAQLGLPANTKVISSDSIDLSNNQSLTSGAVDYLVNTFPGLVKNFTPGNQVTESTHVIGIIDPSIFQRPNTHFGLHNEDSVRFVSFSPNHVLAKSGGSNTTLMNLSGRPEEGGKEFLSIQLLSGEGQNSEITKTVKINNNIIYNQEAPNPEAPRLAVVAQESVVSSAYTFDQTKSVTATIAGYPGESRVDNNGYVDPIKVHSNFNNNPNINNAVEYLINGDIHGLEIQGSNVKFIDATAGITNATITHQGNLNNYITRTIEIDPAIAASEKFNKIRITQSTDPEFYTVDFIDNNGQLQCLRIAKDLFTRSQHDPSTIEGCLDDPILTPTPTATSTTVPPTSTTVPPTPTSTTVPPTSTTVPPTPTSTTVPPTPTSTKVPPTSTTVPPTPTSTKVPPTSTTVPPTPTSTKVPPTSTTVPPTPTSTTVPPTSTTVPPTSTTVPPTSTTVPPTSTTVPPTSTTVPPTSTTVPPTSTTVPPTSTTVPPTSTTVPPTSTTVPPTSTTVPPTPTSTTVPPTPTSTKVPPTSTTVPPTPESHDMFVPFVLKSLVPPTGE